MTSTGPHQLAEDVFACLSDGRFVFMDLRRDRYFCLSRRHSRAAADILVGFCPENRNPASVEDPATTTAVLAALSRGGLLANGDATDRTTLPRRARPVAQPPAQSLAPTASKPRRVPFRPAHLAAFVAASLTASGRLRWQSMHGTVLAIAARNRTADRPPAAGDSAMDELVALFHRFRPLYGRKYHCLFDSVALLEFLARYRHFPRWVFGVRSAPFAAHCWVQHGNCVLNDTVDNARGYTPILVV